ncbi:MULTISPECIES: PLP-dependent cysteine synthase family protein [Paraburkholderia]|uniref:PLP-dependent cysteine synthase family protein n=1 Tax=Paraburkholderia TaxID=1822464 RepID=UPI0022565EF2|nr:MULTISPECIES: cysteine synthase family protein [Paraburkholderia]MCX4162795.1 cysteine synthase family protein [Paraburkholderia megapolitana]MDN7158290.1 cysteine synthase family protein [Paraburkholderia sp. CHISQ3]MDQ6495337.1 cysteine synthase family protein [Paraburkholderia megapolitana]
MKRIAPLPGSLPSIADAIGNTPLVCLDRLQAAQPTTSDRLYAKCEFMNPGGSVKDRLARTLLLNAAREGRLAPGGTVIETTSGNTGVGLAMAGAVLGYRVVLIVADTTTPDKINLLRTCGATVHLVKPGLPADHPDSANATARRLVHQIPGAWFANQFGNPMNWHNAYEGLGRELWHQTAGQIGALVCGAGTGGTLHGVARFLKEQRPDVDIVLAEPPGSAFSARWHRRSTQFTGSLVEGIGNDEVPAVASVADVDYVYEVTDADARSASQALLEREGLLAGPSSGAIVAAALRFCDETCSRRSARHVVALLPDGTRPYLNTFFDNAWCAAHGLQVNNMTCPFVHTLSGRDQA